MQSNTDTRYVPMLFEHPVGNGFDEWRENVRKTELYQRGDTVLIWVNEGDLYPGPFVAEAARPPVQTDVTDAMIEAGAKAFGGCLCDTCCPSASDRDYFGTIYRAMEAARPPVQTDGLVEVMERVSAALHDAERFESISASVRCVDIRAMLEALQRSNDAKDEALRAVVDLVQMYGSTEAHEQVRKALSHSSDGGNNAV
jgi:hypothetical protein